MNTFKASNVKLKDLRRFLDLQGAKIIRTSGGHEIWSHKSLPRPIPIQTHIDPVPEFIVLEILNYFEVSKNKMGELLGYTKATQKRTVGKTKRGKRSKKK
jgi:hypothetical protein